jgi:hypothetical protein
MNTYGVNVEQELFDLLQHEIAVELLRQECPDITDSEIELILHAVHKYNMLY